MGLLPDTHVYSYSQLSTMSECKYNFYLNHIEKAEQASNGFAEMGTLIHDIIDKWAKKEITTEELAIEYDLRFEDEVITPFPKVLKDYKEKAYDIGRKYFEDFDCFDGYTILDTEQKFRTEIAGRPFVGTIDMIMTENSTGKLIVLDHKSKSLSAFKKAEHDMYRQQLLYSKYVYEKYGKYPDILMFNLFKENGLKKSKPFDINEYNEAIAWATEMIEQIETFEDIDFLEAKNKDFFCAEICSQRKNCPNGISD